MHYTFSIFDLWPYFLISVVFIICFFNDLKNSSKIIFTTLFLFSALRYDVGWDYTSYVEEIKGGVDELMISRFEPLSKAILLLSAITNFYPLAFIVFAWLTLKFIKISIDEYSFNPTISWLVYYSMPLFFFASLSTLRQSLATVIILFAFHFAIKRNFFYFFICIIGASFFHLSALLGFLILPLAIIKINRKLNILFLISSFIFATLSKDFLGDYLISFSLLERYNDVYFDSEVSQTASTSSLQYLYYLIAIFNLIFYNKLVSFNDTNKVFISISNFGVVIFNLLFFETITALRISAFFLPFWIYLFPYYGQIFSRKTPKIPASALVLLLILLSFFYLNMYVDSYENNILEKTSFLPYEFWWNNY